MKTTSTLQFLLTGLSAIAAPLEPANTTSPDTAPVRPHYWQLECYTRSNWQRCNATTSCLGSTVSFQIEECWYLCDCNWVHICSPIGSWGCTAAGGEGKSVQEIGGAEEVGEVAEIDELDEVPVPAKTVPEY
ncbi:hypothetical protein OQA88_12503 [Cercophora sp. LCS_1]